MGDEMQTATPFVPGVFYHVFDRGVNRENIFFEERNYPYFLGLFQVHITPVADLYAYCLLKNHFHLLLRIKTDAVLKTASVSKAFNNFLTAYAKAVNKGYGRTGALFQHHFGRIPIFTDSYYTALARYIHQNPRKHGLVKDFRDWPYSSYHLLLSSGPTSMARAQVIDWFGGKEEFQICHARSERRKKVVCLLGNDMD
jgi:REP element-mobilizing transposase RayT